MFLQNDRQITISTAGNRNSKQWIPQNLMWSEFVSKLETPVRSTETLDEYLSFNKSTQDSLKDVGGYVAGTLNGGRRKSNAVMGRDVVTLDLDNIPSGGTDDVLLRISSLNCAFAVYSTRKHSPVSPRLRVLLPLDRACSADEYEPIARKLAHLIGLELHDPSTFQVSRLMYWPSCCRDSQYVFKYNDSRFVSVDGVLSSYTDWKDINQWPQLPGAHDLPRRLAAKQGDPLTKAGVVGAFCRVYDVYRVIDEILMGLYTPCDIPGRYTYTGGSTTGGAIVYDNGKFLYSHHATDPTSGKLCNAFDLVRIHRFGELDESSKADTPTNRLPSYTAMCSLAVEDGNVASLLNQERYERATQDFATAVDNDVNWMAKLAVNSTSGAPAKTTDNILLILENDPLLKGKIAYDEFANKGLAMGALPWDDRQERRQWTDTDDSGIRHYIERVYGITGKDKTKDALTLCAHKNRIDDVRDYLEALEWDGVLRLDRLFIDYLGAKDTAYTRAVARKSLTAAVARAITPGCKYDCMPILYGPQGTGKSTFLLKLGGKWYSDNLQVFEGKEASEMIQGYWINEVGELNGFSRSEINAVKQFLSRNIDVYRKPFGTHTQDYPRRCVFFGTTNDAEFLRDRTGNRRFWPIDTHIQPPTKNIFTDLDGEVDQIWAEACNRFRLGESLYLKGSEEDQAKHEQEAHLQSNVKEGIVAEFLNQPLPDGWGKMSLSERKMFWVEGFSIEGTQTFPRAKACAAEVWCECFNKDISFMKRSDAQEINSIIERLPGWKRYKGSQRFGPYGVQKGFYNESWLG